MGVSQLSGALVREIVNQILLEEYPKQEWRNVCTGVGTPVYDAQLPALLLLWLDARWVRDESIGSGTCKEARSCHFACS